RSEQHSFIGQPAALQAVEVCMRRILLASLGLVAVAWLMPATVAGQSQTQGTTSYTPPKTVDGHPDIQGVWDYRSLTPLQRPAESEGKSPLPDAEISAYEKTRAEPANRDRRDGGAAADVARAYNEFWWDYGRKIVGHQTSLIVDPADGRIPAM